MHRTYSMRSSRAPTASEMQNPPPPASSTKSGRLFGKTPLGESPAASNIDDSVLRYYAGNMDAPDPVICSPSYHTLPPPHVLVAASPDVGSAEYRMPRTFEAIIAAAPSVNGIGRTNSVASKRWSRSSSFSRAPAAGGSQKKLMARRSVKKTWHTFRSRTAGAFGPDLAKKLTQLVKMEKNLMRSMELVGRERMEVAQQLSIWGEAGDDDVSDITDKLGVLMYEIGELEDSFVDRYDQYRVTMKSIRNIEISVQPSRDRKAKIAEQIAHLKYKDPTSPKIVVLEQELVRAEAESLVAEAQLSNITREKLKAAFNYQFDAVREHYEKLAIIAGYGKHLLELVDDTPVTPGETRETYDGYEASRAIIQDCEDALTGWVPQHAAVKSSLSTRARQLSQRQVNRDQQPVDLSEQDRPMDRESWVGEDGQHYDEEEAGTHTTAVDNGRYRHSENGARGRETERPVAA